RGLVGELPLEHRAEPGEVLRQARDTRRVRDPIERRQFERQACDGGGVGVHRWHPDQSCEVSLACQGPSTRRVSQAIAANSATPVNEISSNAANMRGMLSWKPACRIW